MSGHGRPESLSRIVTLDLFMAGMFGAFFYALFIYVVFVALLYFSTFVAGEPEFLSVTVSILAAVACLYYRRLDKHSKLSWFRAAVPVAILFMGAAIVIALKINVPATTIALLAMGVLAFPGGVWSVLSLTVPGFFGYPPQRGKMVAMIILIIFIFLAGATAISLLVPDLGFRAGLLYFGAISLILGGLSRKVTKLPRFQYIAAPRIPLPPDLGSHTSLKHDRQQYFIVLFMFTICLGMLLRIFLNIPEEIVSMNGAWLIISLVAIAVTPGIGMLADHFGRKVFFNLASGICVAMFGLFAFSGQGTNDQWSPSIVMLCFALFGIAFPAILVSEFAIFHELSDDVNRARVIAGCLCIHVTGFAIGLIIGLLFDTPNLAYFFLATNFLTVGLLITSTARETLPSKEELLWPKVLRHLYIYHSGSGTGIYDISFETSNALHYALVTGGLKGIASMITELTRRDGHLTSIQQQNASILFDSGKHVTAALVAEKDLTILHTKLKELVSEFEDLFSVYLRDFVGEIDMFAPVESLVRRIFRPK